MSNTNFATAARLPATRNGSQRELRRDLQPELPASLQRRNCRAGASKSRGFCGHYFVCQDFSPTILRPRFCRDDFAATIFLDSFACDCKMSIPALHSLNAGMLICRGLKNCDRYAFPDASRLVWLMSLQCCLNSFIAVQKKLWPLRLARRPWIGLADAATVLFKQLYRGLNKFVAVTRCATPVNWFG
jgi:hypothetical protein